MNDEYQDQQQDQDRPRRVRRRYPEERPSSNKTLWIILGSVGCISLLGCVGLVGLVGYFGFRAFTNDIPVAQAAADQFLDLLKEGKLDDAYAMTSPEFRSKQDKEQFEAFVKGIETFAQQTSRTTNGARMHQDASGKRVQIQVTLKTLNNATTCTLVMVERDGTWKVDRFTVP